MPYRVSIRTVGSVDRSAHDTLDGALDAIEVAARAAAAGPQASAVDLRARRWAPSEQVRTRAELKGPERWRPSTRAGIDVLGDGSLQAWTGAPERQPVEVGSGEDAYAALRRTLTA
jgi:hypothetical protein